MKTIEIEDAVYSALEARVRGFGEKPNDVIKRLLSGIDRQTASANGTGTCGPSTSEKSPLLKFVESPEYLRGKAKDRYFDVLRFIYGEHPQGFEKLQGFSRGSRVQISKDPKEISQSGRHTYPQQLDGTPFWIMTNLSNERKQTLLQDIMKLLGYKEEIVVFVVRTITSHFLTHTRLPIP
jgi:negative modulator of initiation of replication